MMDTSITNSNRKISRSIFLFLLISYGFPWLLWLPGVLSTQGLIPAIPWPPLFGIGACGPLVAALWLTHYEGGWGAVKTWLRDGFTARIKAGWWLAILSIPFVIPPFALRPDEIMSLGDYIFVNLTINLE